MNSRSAMNDISANSTTEPTPPVTSASENTMTIIHHARTRAARFAIGGEGPSAPVRPTSTLVMMLEITNNTRMPPSSQRS